MSNLNCQNLSELNQPLFLKNIFLADYGLGEFLLAIDFLFFNYFFKKDKRLGEIQINVLTNNLFNLNINFIQRKV